MVDDIAKSNFNDILTNLKRKFEITDSKWTEQKSYEIKFRTQIPVEHEDYNKYCDQWVDEFSYVTDTVWVHKISNTGPKVKFRKQYQCWTYETKEVNKAILFDPRKCRATLDIKVLGDTSCTKKTNRYMRLGLNVLIKIHFQHLHPVDKCNNYSFFVHWCKPLPEAPKPAAPSTEKVSQLVAKVVESAPITAQKAAERAKEVLRKQCVGSSGFIENLTKVGTAPQTPENNNYRQIPVKNESTVAVDQPSIAQVIVNASDGQTSENIFHVYQVVFDSATQTLQELVPNNGIHNLPNHQLLQVQVPAETTHIVNAVPSNGNQIIQL